MKNIETIATAGNPEYVLDAARYIRRATLKGVDLGDTRNDKLVADVQRLYTAAMSAHTVSEYYFTEASRNDVYTAVGSLYGMRLDDIHSAEVRRNLSKARDYISYMIRPNLQAPAGSNQPSNARAEARPEVGEDQGV